MFDDEKTNNQPAKNNLPEDIFADVEQGPAAPTPTSGPIMPQAPRVGAAVNDQMKPAMPQPAAPTIPNASGSGNKTLKIVIIVLVVLIVLFLLIIGGRYLYLNLAGDNPVDQGAVDDQGLYEDGFVETGNLNSNQVNTNEEAGDVMVILPAESNLPKDSDADGLTDEEEVILGTDPSLADSDLDGLFDGQEVNQYKTDPLNADSDGDGYKDGEEVASGYNPNGPGRLYDIN